MSDEQNERLRALQELILRVAEGDYSARGEFTDALDEIDATTAAVNTLAEDYEAAQHARDVAEGLLRDERDAYDKAPGMFCSVDAESFHVIKCNQTLASAVLRSKEDVVGTDLVAFMHATSRAQVREALLAIRAGRPAAVLKHMLVGADGSERAVHLSGSRVTGGDGAVRRLRLILRDITEEKELEQKLFQAQKMESVGQLAGGIAHDFNNLLTVIRNYAVFLEAPLVDNESALNDLAEIQGAIQRAAELTGHLLAFSQRQLIQPVATDLNALVERTQRMLRRVIREEIEVRTQLATESTTVIVDPTQLEQVIVNLALNAQDAMVAPGRLTITTELVDFGARELDDLTAGRYVRLSVTDTGTGMTDEVRAHAFEPFFTTKPVGAGTGLGLATSYGLVKQFGGEILIESEPGRFTTILIHLPLATAEVTAGHDDAPTPGLFGGDERILLVEDDARVRETTKRALVNVGYSVVEAADGEEGFRLAQEHDADLVITDVIMPRLGGVAFVQRLRELEPNVKVVFISGYVDEANRKLTLNDGTAFVQKPFVSTRLLSVVRGLLDG